jgi:short-subunit dehydrogenase
VNISSVFGLIGVPSQSSYCATKFAVRGFSEALWTELADSRIGVTVVHPGGVRTNIVRDSRSYAPEARDRMVERFERMAMDPELVAERIVRAVERGRMRVLVCRETFVIDWLKRAFPVSIHGLLRWAFRRLGPVG